MKQTMFMRQEITMKKTIYVRIVILMLLGVTPGVLPSRAAIITQKGSDASGFSSFTSNNWSDNLAPAAGNDYVSATTLRTPAVSGAVTFAGDSLTMNSGGVLVFKGTGTADVVTVNNLTLKTGSAVVNAMSGNLFTLAGSIKVNSGNVGNLQVTVNNFGYTVSSVISGAGSMSFTSTYTVQNDKAVILAASNSYTGGSSIGNYANVVAAVDGAFGAGNVTVNSGGALTLQTGITNNYIADSANLILSSGLASSSIFLNFVGTDSLAGLSLDGGTTYLASGRYTAAQLNTLYGSSAFWGVGELNVVPEPSAAFLMIAAGVVCLVGRHRRQSIGALLG